MKYSYIKDIDGLRAIAVLGVVFYHLKKDFFPGGFVGVDVFFVISGYVVTKSLMEHQLSTTGIIDYFIGFYSRRITRIFPALILCLFVTSVFVGLLVPSSWLSESVQITALWGYFGFSNFALASSGDGYYAARAEFNPFTHTWSLAVEEQFYLLLPIIVFFIGSRDSRFRGLRMSASYILIIMAGLSFTFGYYETENDRIRAFYLIYSRFWELACGCILYLYHLKINKRKKNLYIGEVLLLSGLSLIFLSYFWIPSDSFPVPNALYAVLGTVFAISGVAGQNMTSKLSSIVLRNPISIYVGLISYSLYLWHWPVVVLMRWTIGVQDNIYLLFGFILSLVLAIFSYHIIECPSRRLVGRLGANKISIIIVGLLASSLFCFLSSNIFKYQSNLTLSVTGDRTNWYPHAWQVAPSEYITEKSERTFAGKTMFVVGDSHGAAYSTMFQMLIDIDNLRVHSVNKGGCAVAFLYRNSTDECKAVIEGSISEIESVAQPGDVVFLPGLRLGRLVSDSSVFDDESVFDAMYGTRATAEILAARSESDAIVGRLLKKSLKVILEAPKPVFKSMPFRCSDWFNSHNPICVQGFEISKNYLLSYREPIMKSIDYLVEKNTGLLIWDPFPVLCPRDPCSALDGKQPLFFDSDHLSAHGNRVLYPDFRRFLRSALLMTNTDAVGPSVKTDRGLRFNSGVDYLVRSLMHGKFDRFGQAHFYPSEFRVNANEFTDAALVSELISLPVGEYTILANLDWNVVSEVSGKNAAHISIHGNQILFPILSSFAKNHNVSVRFSSDGTPFRISFGLGGWSKGKGEIKVNNLTILGNSLL